MRGIEVKPRLSVSLDYVEECFLNNAVVTPDNAEIGRRAAEYLRGEGFRQLACAGIPFRKCYRERVESFQ